MPVELSSGTVREVALQRFARMVVPELRLGMYFVLLSQRIDDLRPVDQEPACRVLGLHDSGRARLVLQPLRHVMLHIAITTLFDEKLRTLEFRCLIKRKELQETIPNAIVQYLDHQSGTQIFKLEAQCIAQLSFRLPARIVCVHYRFTHILRQEE